MVGWECPTNPRQASGLDPEAVHVTPAMVRRLADASEQERGRARVDTAVTASVTT
jgi:hypothetical protein